MWKDYLKISTWRQTGTILTNIPSKQMRTIRITIWEKEHLEKFLGGTVGYKKIRKSPSRSCSLRTNVVRFIFRNTKWMSSIGPSPAAAQIWWRCGDIHDEGHPYQWEIKVLCDCLLAYGGITWYSQRRILARPSPLHFNIAYQGIWSPLPKKDDSQRLETSKYLSEYWSISN